MLDKDRDRLITFLRFFSSNQDGEVISAARRAHELIRRCRLDWEEVIAKNGGAEAPKKRWSSGAGPGTTHNTRNAHNTNDEDAGAGYAGNPVDDIEQCQALTAYLTAWEVDFITSIAGSIRAWGRPTEKQKAVLNRIVLKLKRRGLWREAA